MLTRTPLADDVVTLRRNVAARTPGRLGEIIDARVARLLDRPDRPEMPADLDDAETVVVDLVEQFVVDVHGIDDDRFERLRDHYTDDEVVAIVLHVALADGFAKLEAVAPADPDLLSGPTDET